MSSGVRGQTECPECEVLINNSVVPEFCQCGEYLGGSYTPSQPKITTCKISENVFSVIQNRTGPITRIFVNTQTKFCQSDKCSDKRGALINSGQSLQTFTCEHLDSLDKGYNVPKTKTIKLSEVKDLITQDCYELLSNYASNGELDIHEIDDNFVVVNSFSPVKHELPTQFSHLKNKKCSLQACKKKTRIHTLAFKDSKFCCHELVACVASKGAVGPSSVKTEKKTLQLNYEETSKRVLEDVRKHFPQMHEFEKKTHFLKSERLNLEKIRNLANSEDLIKEAKLCSMCGRICEEYSHSKATNSYLVTLGEMERVNIPAFICENCNIIQYPKMCEFGFVNIHTKLILSFPFLMDICNELIIGSPITECLERKLTLYGEKGELFGEKDDYEEAKVDDEIAEYCKEDDFSDKQFEDEQAELEFHPRSLAIKIEKFAIAIISALITGESLDRVVCLICGSYPKIISTDGEVKESVAIQDNMVFEDDGEPLPTLQEFLSRLQVQVVSSSFFQHVPPLKVNMYQLPKNIAPRLTGVQQNSERKKKTQFGEVDTSNVDLHRMASLVRDGEFDGQDLGKYSEEELKKLAKMCDVDVKNKSATVIQNILKTSYERLLSGQSNCHKYTIAQRRTGGFQDAWCEHLFKVAASVQARQESVLDPVDIIHSIKTPPVLHVCDDACTVISNQFLTMPETASILYGQDRRGCFTPPIRGVKADPSTTPNVTDILPLKTASTEFDYSAVTDGGWRHPDTGKTDRFVMGHRLQMTSHRKDTCTNHVLDLCDSGRMVKSMNQEALNVKRKNTRVRQDRPRNFTTSFLFNYILDFIHNLEKFKKQRKQLGSDVRNEISWRVILPANQKNKGKTSKPKKRKRNQSLDSGLINQN